MLLLISSYREVAVQPRSRLCAWVCVYVRVHPVSVIGRGCENAGRSICSGWCQQTVPVNSDSISAGICGNWRERGGWGGKEGGGAAGARGDTGRIVPLSDSPFSLISSRSSYRKPDRKKNLSLFTPGLSNFSFLLHLPLFHSGFYRTPLPFFSITGFVMRLSWKLAFWFLNISPVLQLNRHTMTAHIFASLPKFKILNVTKQ